MGASPRAGSEFALYLYALKDGSTRKVSTNPRADYRYPHGEAMPK